jgi:hypothetical protein
LQIKGLAVARKSVPTASTTAVTDKVPPSEPVPSISKVVVPGRKSCRYVYSKYFVIKEGPKVLETWPASTDLT